MSAQNNVAPFTGQEPAPDTEQAALAMLGTLFPHIRRGIETGRQPPVMPLLIEAKAIGDLIHLATNGPENQDEMPDGATADAASLLTRMLNAAILIEGGDLGDKGDSTA